MAPSSLRTTISSSSSPRRTMPIAIGRTTEGGRQTDMANHRGLPDGSQFASTTEIVRKRPRLIVLHVPRRIEQRDRTPRRDLAKGLDGIGIGVELRRVTLAELLPALGAMAEPLAERRAGGDVLEPDRIAELVLADPARPDAIDQDALPVARRARLIDPFDLQLCHAGCSAAPSAIQ